VAGPAGFSMSSVRTAPGGGGSGDEFSLYFDLGAGRATLELQPGPVALGFTGEHAEAHEFSFTWSQFEAGFGEEEWGADFGGHLRGGAADILDLDRGLRAAHGIDAAKRNAGLGQAEDGADDRSLHWDDEGETARFHAHLGVVQRGDIFGPGAHGDRSAAVGGDLHLGRDLKASAPPEAEGAIVGGAVHDLEGAGAEGRVGVGPEFEAARFGGDGRLRAAGDAGDVFAVRGVADLAAEDAALGRSKDDLEVSVVTGFEPILRAALDAERRIDFHAAFDEAATAIGDLDLAHGGIAGEEFAELDRRGHCEFRRQVGDGDRHLDGRGDAGVVLHGVGETVGGDGEIGRGFVGDGRGFPRGGAGLGEATVKGRGLDQVAQGFVLHAVDPQGDLDALPTGDGDGEGAGWGRGIEHGAGLLFLRPSRRGTREHGEAEGDEQARDETEQAIHAGRTCARAGRLSTLDPRTLSGGSGVLWV